MHTWASRTSRTHRLPGPTQAVRLLPLQLNSPELGKRPPNTHTPFSLSSSTRAGDDQVSRTHRTPGGWPRRAPLASWLPCQAPSSSSDSPEPWPSSSSSTSSSSSSSNCWMRSL